MSKRNAISLLAGVAVLLIAFAFYQPMVEATESAFILFHDDRQTHTTEAHCALVASDGEVLARTDNVVDLSGQRFIPLQKSDHQARTWVNYPACANCAKADYNATTCALVGGADDPQLTNGWVDSCTYSPDDNVALANCGGRWQPGVAGSIIWLYQIPGGVSGIMRGDLGGGTSADIGVKPFVNTGIFKWVDQSSTTTGTAVPPIVQRFGNINSLLLSLVPLLLVISFLASSWSALYVTMRYPEGSIAQAVGIETTLLVVFMISIFLLPTFVDFAQGAAYVSTSGAYESTSRFGALIWLLFTLMPLAYIVGILGIVAVRAVSIVTAVRSA